MLCSTRNILSAFCIWTKNLTYIIQLMSNNIISYLQLWYYIYNYGPWKRPRPKLVESSIIFTIVYTLLANSHPMKSHLVILHPVSFTMENSAKKEMISSYNCGNVLFFKMETFLTSLPCKCSFLQIIQCKKFRTDFPSRRAQQEKIFQLKSDFFSICQYFIK